ncbi:MAG: porin family protein [Sphingopyxis sp.]|nr:porin family protein [Sphingopyxis sp.]
MAIMETEPACAPASMKLSGEWYSGVGLMRFVHFVGFGALLALGTFGAQAADVGEEEVSSMEGAYIVARLAGAFNNKSEFSMEFNNYTTDVVSEYDDYSFMGAIAFGYRLEDMFSIEIEGGHTAVQAHAHTLMNVPTASSTVSARFDGDNAGGKASVSYAMVNFVTEQETGTFARPYMSFGLGAAQVNVENFSINLPAPIDPLTAGNATLIDDTEMSYAWQIGAGAIIDITKNLALEAGYRYFRVEDVDVRTSTDNETAFSLSQHQALLGVRVNF